jgi:putative ABC transport system permease protein
MNFVAMRMLLGDRAKFLGLIFAIAFATFLMAHQSSIFWGLMRRTTSQIKDISDTDIWVMDRQTQYIDEVKTLNENDLYRVRGVAGVEWAVQLFKGNPRAKTSDGHFRNVILMGLDDATLVGAPRKMLVGSIEDLRKPDSVIIDRAGFLFFFPGEPLAAGKTMEMNDHKVTIVGVCEASAPFATFPVMFARYNLAINFVGRERNTLSFILVKAKAGVVIPELCARIDSGNPDLKAMSGEDFEWATIRYYTRNTGIPVNFGITVTIALIVGTVVAGQTFYIFTIENLKQFGALKAIGVTNLRIVGMILLQAMVVGLMGYALGIAMCALFFDLTRDAAIQLRGFILHWQIAAGTSMVVFFIVILASLLSIRKVMVLEPAIVFRG